MTDSVILVFTDTTGIARIEAETMELPPIALRSDQVKANQILFFNVDDNTVEHLALLNAAEPFTIQPNGSYVANVVEYMGLMEPIEFDRVHMNHAYALNCIPALNFEAITVDPDELEIDVNYLGSQMVDEMIVNRRSINQVAAKRTLEHGEAEDLISARAQLEQLIHGL